MGRVFHGFVFFLFLNAVLGAKIKEKNKNSPAHSGDVGATYYGDVEAAIDTKVASLKMDTQNLNSQVAAWESSIEKSETKEESAKKDQGAAQKDLATMVAGVKVQAAEWGERQAEERLNPLLSSFAVWKEKTLNNPTINANAAAYAATKPFEDAQAAIQTKVAEYIGRAESLRMEGEQLQTDAKVLAAGAILKQNLYDSAGAMAEYAEAQAKMGQAGKLASGVEKLRKRVQELDVQATDYGRAIAIQRARVLHRLDPKTAPPAGPMSAQGFDDPLPSVPLPPWPAPPA